MAHYRPSRAFALRAEFEYSASFDEPQQDDNMEYYDEQYDDAGGYTYQAYDDLQFQQLAPEDEDEEEWDEAGHNYNSHQSNRSSSSQLQNQSSLHFSPPPPPSHTQPHSARASPPPQAVEVKRGQPPLGCTPADGCFDSDGFWHYYRGKEPAHVRLGRGVGGSSARVELKGKAKAKASDGGDERAVLDLTNSPDASPTPEQQSHKQKPRKLKDKKNENAFDLLSNEHRAFFEAQFDNFTEMQSRLFNPTYETDENLVVSAPTGSGKTVIFELAILSTLAKEPDSKVVYIAPTRSLCSERFNDWKVPLGKLGVSVVEFTGETTTGNAKLDKQKWEEVEAGRVIITTPEKWDITSRIQSRDETLRKVKLFCLDEIHSLASEGRGAVVEVIVSRMKRILRNPRFVAVSATVPNIEDVAQWLDARSFVFGDEHRPVPLKKDVFALPSGWDPHAWLKSVDKQLFDLISAQAEGRPALIFCDTRKGCMQAAEAIQADYEQAIGEETMPWAKPSDSTGAWLADSKLREIARFGIAVHHAGLSRDERHWVENEFTKANDDGAIKVVCCTSTLAQGVNLPARMVILRGGEKWENGSVVRLSDLDVLQMIGRAGRRKFDDKGAALIICKDDDEEHFSDLIHARTPLESSLHENLIDHLNCEIVLGTITDFASALAWLRSTFLFVRIHSNPKHYTTIAEDASPGGWNDPQPDLSPEEQLETFAVNALQELVLSGVIVEVKRGNRSLYFKTKYAEILARSGLTFFTFKIILDLKPKADMATLLCALSRAKEFADICWRTGERRAYAPINDGLKYKVQLELDLHCDKVNFLVQTVLESVSLDGVKVDYSSPSSEIYQIWRSAPRIVSAMVEVALFRKDGGAKTRLELLSAVKCRAWPRTSGVFRLVHGIGAVKSRQLSDAGIDSIKSLIALRPHRLQAIAQLGIKQAQVTVNDAKSFPQLNLIGKIVQEEAVEGGVRVRAEVEVTLLNAATVKRDQFWAATALALTSEGDLINERREKIAKIAEGSILWRFTITLTRPSQRILVYVGCEEVVDAVAELELARTRPWPQAQPSMVVSDDEDDDDKKVSSKPPSPFRPAKRKFETIDLTADDDERDSSSSTPSVAKKGKSNSGDKKYPVLIVE